MNLIEDSHSRIDKDATVGNCRIKHLLFADDLALLGSFQQGDWFSAIKLELKQAIKRPSYYVSPEMQDSVGYTAVKRLHTATGR